VSEPAENQTRTPPALLFSLLALAICGVLDAVIVIGEWMARGWALVPRAPDSPTWQGYGRWAKGALVPILLRSGLACVREVVRVTRDAHTFGGSEKKEV
jgi:hypothetical protein